MHTATHTTPYSAWPCHVSLDSDSVKQMDGQTDKRTDGEIQIDGLTDCERVTDRKTDTVRDIYREREG